MQRREATGRPVYCTNLVLECVEKKERKKGKPVVVDTSGGGVENSARSMWRICPPTEAHQEVFQD
jgi:hypothetical protein